MQIILQAGETLEIVLAGRNGAVFVTRTQDEADTLQVQVNRVDPQGRHGVVYEEDLR